MCKSLKIAIEITLYLLGVEILKDFSECSSIETVLLDPLERVSHLV